GPGRARGARGRLLPLPTGPGPARPRRLGRRGYFCTFVRLPPYWGLPWGLTALPRPYSQAIFSPRACKMDEGVGAILGLRRGPGQRFGRSGVVVSKPNLSVAVQKSASFLQRVRDADF